MSRLDAESARPAKRPRIEPTPALSASYTLPLSVFQEKTAPTFSLPAAITSFSYTPERELLLASSGRQDEALKYYKPPPVGCDLKTGYERCVWRPEGVLEGIDSLLASFVLLCSESGRFA